MEHLVRVLLKVVHRIAQIGLLRVVEGNHVLVIIRRHGQILTRRFYLVVARNVNRRFRYRFFERLILHGLCLVEHLVRVLLKVVHRVAQVVPLRIVEVDLVLAGSNRQLCLVRAVVVVAVNINHFGRRRDHSPELLIVHDLCVVKHIGRVLLKVVHRVAQVGSFLPLRDILRVSRHRLLNLRLPARKRPAGLAGRRCRRVIQVICRCRCTKVCGVLVILCLKVAIVARCIRDFARDHFIEFIIEIDDLIKLIKRNRFSYIILLST